MWSPEFRSLSEKLKCKKFWVLRNLGILETLRIHIIFRNPMDSWESYEYLGGIGHPFYSGRVEDTSCSRFSKKFQCTLFIWTREPLLCRLWSKVFKISQPRDFLTQKLYWMSISSCVIDLMDWADETSEKEEGGKDGGADPDEVEVGQADVLPHRLPRVVVAIVMWAETPATMEMIHSSDGSNGWMQWLPIVSPRWSLHLSYGHLSRICPSSIPSLHFSPFVFPDICEIL